MYILILSIITDVEANDQPDNNDRNVDVSVNLVQYLLCPSLGVL